MPHNLLRRTKFEELLKGNPELYIKTELDPIAEDLLMISKQFVQVLMHLF
jgi:hypothetical protein